MSTRENALKQLPNQVFKVELLIMQSPMTPVPYFELLGFAEPRQSILDRMCEKGEIGSKEAEDKASTPETSQTGKEKRKGKIKACPIL
jgi:hypothetical protein